MRKHHVALPDETIDEIEAEGYVAQDGGDLVFHDELGRETWRYGQGEWIAVETPEPPE